MAYAPYSFTNINSGDGNPNPVVNIPWPFLSRTHVKVYFDDVLKAVGTDYIWLSDSQLRLLTAAFGMTIKLVRETPAEPLVTFGRGSVIPTKDLNTAMLQALYRVEEIVIEAAASVAYADLVGIPSSFPPAAHTHDAAVIATGVLSPAVVGSGARDGTKFLRDDGTWAAPPSAAGGSWGSITGSLAAQSDLNTALAGKAPLAHTHASLADVTGLQDALNLKMDKNQAGTTGLAVLATTSQAAGRNAIGIYVGDTDPGAVPDGSLWFS